MGSIDLTYANVWSPRPEARDLVTFQFSVFVSFKIRESNEVSQRTIWLTLSFYALEK